MTEQTSKDALAAQIEAAQNELDAIFAYMPTAEVERAMSVLMTLSPNDFIYAVS